MRISDWSSDVCSSDLHRPIARGVGGHVEHVLNAVDLLLERGGHGRRHSLGIGPGVGGPQHEDRKSVVQGKSVSVRVDLGGSRLLKKKRKHQITSTHWKRKLKNKQLKK